MRYKTRLLVVFVTAAALTSMLSVGCLYVLARHYLHEEYRAKVLSVAATAAALIDGDAHRGIQGREDEKTESYRKLRDSLRRARDANRRDDTWIKYLHTLRLAPQDSRTLEFGVDPEEDFRNVGRAGDVYRVEKGRSIDLNRAQVDAEFMEDEFGRWVTANAPIKDSQGKTTGAVLVEVAADRLQAKLLPLAWSAAGAIALAMTLAIAGSLVVAGRVTRPLEALRVAVEAIGRGQFDQRLEVRSKDEFGEVAQAVNKMAAGLKERETVKSAFARYVSRQVMDKILDSGVSPEVHGDRRKITVLFSDIRGFTTLSEQMRPEGVVALLNEYFERMVEVVYRNHGTLDKFLGDGMMVIFGAPEDDPYQEEHALQTALEMREELHKLSLKWEQEGRIKIGAGIGINSGTAIVGNIGASERMEYTAIGDTVNLASRLQTATREYDTDILISEYTHSAVRGAYKTQRIGSVQVKGRAEPVLTYAVEGPV